MNKYLLPVLATILSGCATTTSSRYSPDFEEASNGIERIAILPPDIILFEKTVDGQHRIYDEKTLSIYREVIIEETQLRLAEKGFIPVKITADQLATRLSNHNVKIASLKNRYDEVSKNLYAKPKISEEEAKQFRESVGEAANIIASGVNADALLVVNLTGQIKSTGKAATELAASTAVLLLTGVSIVSAPEMEIVEVALVDGLTGDILWSDRKVVAGKQGESIEYAMISMPDDSDTSDMHPDAVPIVTEIKTKRRYEAAYKRCIRKQGNVGQIEKCKRLAEAG